MLSTLRRSRRTLFFSLALLALASVVLVGFSRWGWDSIWDHWQSRQYVARSKAFLDRKLPEEAEAAAAKAIVLDPANPEAYRAMIGLQPRDAVGARLMLRSKLADIDPADHQNLKALVQESILVARPRLALKGINELLAKEGETPAVLRLAAEWNLAVGKLPEAARFARDYLKTQPTDPAVAFIAAVGELSSPDEQVANRARQALEQLPAGSPNEGVALRALRDDALRRKDAENARAFAKKVAARPDATFDDSLAAADLEAKANPDSLETSGPQMLQQAGKDPRKLLIVSNWLQARGRADLFNRDSPQAGVGGLASTIAKAQRLVRESNWLQLRSLASGDSWNTAEALRLAYLARAAKGLGQDEDSRSNWNQATQEALKSTETARAFAGVVKGWSDWTNEYQDYLWRASSSAAENTPWALGLLFASYDAQRSSSGMLRVSQAMYGNTPDDAAVANNLAYFQLLRGNSTEKARALVGDLRTKHPADPVIASTFALSELKRGDANAAIAILEKLPQALQDSDSVKACRVSALLALGRTTEANALAATVDRAKLYPEELLMLSGT